MDDCIFCKIIKGEVSTEFVYKDDKVVVFEDNNPQAPVHLLVVPVEHVKDVTQASDEIWVNLKETALKLAAQKDIRDFRLSVNVGDAAMVTHLHLHLLGGVSKEDKL